MSYFGNVIRNCGAELGVDIWTAGVGAYSTSSGIANSGIKGFLMNGDFGGTAKFNGEFAGGYRGHAGTGVLRYAFN